MGEYNDVVVTKVFDGEVVAASGNALSGVIDLGSVSQLGSTGLQVYLSGDGTAQFDYIVSNHLNDFITPSGVSAIASSVIKTSGPGSDGKDAYSFEVIIHRYMKIKVTETGTSDSITVTAYLATN
jgi:hypothetical protein